MSKTIEQQLQDISKQLEHVLKELGNIEQTKNTDIKTGHYWATRKGSTRQEVIFYTKELSFVKLFGTEIRHHLKDFDIICEVEPPTETKERYFIVWYHNLKNNKKGTIMYSGEFNWDTMRQKVLQRYENKYITIDDIFINNWKELSKQDYEQFYTNKQNEK
jgi:hypothetical protein